MMCVFAITYRHRTSLPSQSYHVSLGVVASEPGHREADDIYQDVSVLA